MIAVSAIGVVILMLKFISHFESLHLGHLQSLILSWLTGVHWSVLGWY